MKLKYWLKSPFRYLLIALAYLVRRDRNTWVFGSTSGLFIDNSKYLFIYANEHINDINPVWISKNKETVKYINNLGFKAFHRKSFKGVYYTLKAKFYIYSWHISDISTWAYNGAVKINLWHGIPLKKIEFDIQTGPTAINYNGSIKSRLKYPENYVKPDYILAPSEKVQSSFSSAFNVSPERLMNFGYPRNEILVNNIEYAIQFIKRFEPALSMNLLQKLQTYNEVFIYLPTWRDTGADIIYNSKIEFKAINNILEKQNSLLLMKLHKHSQGKAGKEKFSNIIYLNQNIDIYPLLQFTTTLITDYSSIIFDYALLKKRIIFFCYDKEDYINNREIYLDYEAITKNYEVAYNFNELLELLKKPKHAVKSNELIEKVANIEQTKNASLKIINFIKNTES